MSFIKNIVSLIILISPIVNLWAQTPVSGSVSGTWTTSGNPFQVVGEITIATGNTLTIQSGVEIYFQVDTGFVVQGTLNALGTEADSIIITVDPAYVSQFAGIRFYNGSIGVISYASIRYGSADNTLPGNRGGAIYFEGSTLQINNCEIRNCSADGLGGGIAIASSSAIIENNKIHNNSATYGGGIWTGADDTIIRNNYFYANSVNNAGGGVHATGNSNQPRVEKNIFYENTANEGGGIGFNAGNNAILINNTFYNNLSTSNGGAVQVKLHTVGSHPKMINNIYWGNYANNEGNQIYIEAGASLTINYCTIQGGMSDIANYGTLNYGPDNLSTNPLFKDAADADFHLSSGSPCIDTGGDTLSPPSTDFDGNPTNQDGDNSGTAEFDIGAFEYTNTPPVITSSPVISVDENEPYTYQVIAVDPDPGDDLTYELTVNPGFLSIDDNTGEITGIPGNDDVGFNPVTIRVSDLHGGIDTQSYTLEVVEVINNPPVVDNIPDQSIEEGGAFSAILLNNYVDDPDDPDSEINWIVSGNVALTVNISGANVATISMPNANWFGSETITFTAIDDGGLSDNDQATFTVTPINDAPVVSNIANQTRAEGINFASIDLDDYVTDPDNPDGELTWTSSTTNDITVTITDRVASITVNDAEWSGSETVTFTVEDPAGLTDDDDVMFTVTAVNDPPVVSNIQNQTIAEGSGFTSINLDDFVSDADNPDTEISWIASGTTSITVMITDRIATITPNDGEWNGSETVTFTAEDPAGLTDSDDVTFTVTAVNDPPAVANIPNQTIPEGGSFTDINLDNYVSDADNADAEISWTASPTTNITVTITDRVATIIANNPEWNGSELVTFTAEDPGELTDNDNVNFTVSAFNDPPIVGDIPDQIVAEGSSFASINLDDYVIDADNTDAEINWISSATTNITVTITDRVATITVNDPEWNGSESVTFTAEDPNGLTDSDAANFTITPVNDPPVIADIPDQSITEDGSFTSITLDNYVSDADNADTEINWTVSATTDVTVIITDRIASITVNDPEWGGSETVTFTAEDPAGLTDNENATFLVTAINESPEILPYPMLEFNEDDSLVVVITQLYDYVEDPDHPDSLLIITIKAGQNVITYNDSPKIIVKAPENWNGSDTLEIKVSDGELADSVKVAVLVKSINDVPFFVDLPDGIELNNTYDSTLTMNQYAMDVDSPNDNLNWSFEASNSVLNIEFDEVSTDLTLSAYGYEGIIKVRCTITDDSSASVTDSFYVDVDDPTAIKDMAGIIPLEYILDQNYPNPFNPSTSIPFGMMKAGNVKIEVYNILGQKVQILYDGRKEAGYHIVQFNAGDLANGLYFFRMKTKEFDSIKKMILMK